MEPLDDVGSLLLRVAATGVLRETLNLIFPWPRGATGVTSTVTEFLSSTRAKEGVAAATLRISTALEIAPSPGSSILPGPIIPPPPGPIIPPDPLRGAPSGPRPPGP